MLLGLLAEKGQKDQGRKCKTVQDYLFQFLDLVIGELAALIRRAYCKFCRGFAWFR